MSHIVQIDLEITDLDALEAAAKRLGLELVRGQKAYSWFGRSVGDSPLPAGFTAADLGKCEHALRIPGNPTAYEVGVVKRRDGRPGYSLMWDFWRGGYGMEEKVGVGASKLRQSYSASVAQRYWQRKGYKTSETRKEDGTLLITATR